jgi:hypothetical protein
MTGSRPAADRQSAQLSRRGLFPALAGAAGALFILLGARRAAAQPKTPKKIAKYQDHPNKGQSCSQCKYFRPPASCQLVAGKIFPTGWCIYFAKKA